MTRPEAREVISKISDAMSFLIMHHEPEDSPSVVNLAKSIRYLSITYLNEDPLNDIEDEEEYQRQKKLMEG